MVTKRGVDRAGLLRAAPALHTTRVMTATAIPMNLAIRRGRPAVIPLRIMQVPPRRGTAPDPKVATPPVLLVGPATVGVVERCSAPVRVRPGNPITPAVRICFVPSLASTAARSTPATCRTSPKLQPGVTRARPSDIPAVVAMMRRCSRITLQNRFHGPTDGIAFTIDQLKRNVDMLALAWEGLWCVGMGALAPDSGGAFHLGLLVQDDRQRQGIGTRMVRSLTERARHRGVRSVHADVLGDNRGLVGALRRLGSTSVVLEHGTYSVDIDLVRRLATNF
jgi:GNAT superfamily N-acetyltransferase